VTRAITGQGHRGQDRQIRAAAADHRLPVSARPRYTVGTIVEHLDLAALEVPCPDPGTAGWLSQTLETLGKQRREAAAAVRALDELRTELVDGLGSQAIRLESHTPDEKGDRW
jgi:hypothetical protein